MNPDALGMLSMECFDNKNPSTFHLSKVILLETNYLKTYGRQNYAS